MRLAIVAATFAISTAAVAQEPVGCDKFKWPLEREKALLVAAPAFEGQSANVGSAVKLRLLPFAEAKLPLQPARQPKAPDSYAGFVSFSAPSSSGTYRVTLSEGAWIDVVQDGREVKSGAFSGATGCEGLRKSVKFDLRASTFVVQVSGTKAQHIAIAVTPD